MGLDSLDAVLRVAFNARADVVGFVVPVQCVEDGPGAGTRVDHVKLFRNLPGVEFEGRIHEQVLGSLRAAMPRGRIERIPGATVLGEDPLAALLRLRREDPGAPRPALLLARELLFRKDEAVARPTWRGWRRRGSRRRLPPGRDGRPPGRACGGSPVDAPRRRARSRPRADAGQVEALGG